MISSLKAATPSTNEAFLRALRKHQETLSPHEIALFSTGTAEAALHLATLCDQGHTVRSKSRRFSKAICGAVDGLRRYFKVIEIAISANPQFTALIWGGLVFIIEARTFNTKLFINLIWMAQVAAKYTEFFDTISAMLELIKEDLSYYHEYATVLYQKWDKVQGVRVLTVYRFKSLTQ